MVYLACIVAYLFLLGGIAIWKSREVKNQSDFAVAGRSLSPWMMVCTMLAVWIGTGSIVGNAEQTYETGMAAMLLPIGTLAGMILLSLIATRARNVEANTVPEIIERRFGPVARNLAMLSLVVAYMVIVSYQFNAGGAVLEVIVGDKAPVTVNAGDRLTRDQLTKGRLRFECDSDEYGVQRFAVRPDSHLGGTTGEPIRMRIDPKGDGDQSLPVFDGEFSVVSVRKGGTNRLRYDREILVGDVFVVTEIPVDGIVEVVDPILSARHATTIAAAFIIAYAALAGLMSLAWMDLVTGSIIMLTMVIAFPIYWVKSG